MELETSDKTSSFGKKPHIKKGYYPGKLQKVEVFMDRDGKPKVGKFGQQLIFTFQIFKEAPVGTIPTEPLMIASEDGTEQIPVVIPKFVYHKYKKTDKDDKWIEGEYQTAITQKSAITGILKALGWIFSASPVDPEKFIGNFVELNIDDYQQSDGDKMYKASGITGINKIEGLKESEEPKESVSEESTEDKNAKIQELETQFKKLDSLKEEGNLTKDGYKQASEQLKAQIEELRK